MKKQALVAVTMAVALATPTFANCEESRPMVMRHSLQPYSQPIYWSDGFLGNVWRVVHYAAVQYVNTLNALTGDSTRYHYGDSLNELHHQANGERGNYVDETLYEVPIGYMNNEILHVCT